MRASCALEAPRPRELHLGLLPLVGALATVYPTTRKRELSEVCVLCGLLLSGRRGRELTASR